MAIVNGTYVPLSNLMFMADPRNSKCYVGSGTTAKNQVDNTNLTMTSTGYAGSVWTATALPIQSAATYSPTMPAGYTIIQWINPTTQAGGTFNFTAGSNVASLSMRATTKMYFQSYSATDLVSNSTTTTGAWQMWAATFSGTGTAGGSGTAKIFLNGNLDNSATQAGSASISSVVQIGVTAYGVASSQIGPTLFYTRALSDTEVRNVFQAYRGWFSL